MKKNYKYLDKKYGQTNNHNKSENGGRRIGYL